MTYHHHRFLMWGLSVGGSNGSVRIKTYPAAQFKPWKNVTMNYFRTYTRCCLFCVHCVHSFPLRSFLLRFKACKLLSLAFVLQRWLGLKDMSGIGLGFLSVRHKRVKRLSWKSTVRVLFSFPIIFYQRNKNKDQDFCLGGSRLKRAVWNVLIMECFDFFLEFFFGGVSLVCPCCLPSYWRARSLKTEFKSLTVSARLSQHKRVSRF